MLLIWQATVDSKKLKAAVHCETKGKRVHRADIYIHASGSGGDQDAGARTTGGRWSNGRFRREVFDGAGMALWPHGIHRG
jgi:hypothetical protein